MFCYFGAKRFDRGDKDKVDMATVSGLLETSHRIPNLDYHDLMKLTYILTKDSRQIEEMFKRIKINSLDISWKLKVCTFIYKYKHL